MGSLGRWCLILALFGLPGPLPAVDNPARTPGSDPIPHLTPDEPNPEMPAARAPLPVTKSQGGKGPAPDGSDPAAILHACWTPAQLAGSPRDRIIQRGLKPDTTPPPAWAISAAANALPPLAPGLRGSIREVEPRDPQARLVALTFDLCELANERSGYDAELVNGLREFGVKATFFAGGKWLRTHPEQAMQLMADPNFEIGNHAWTHANLRLVSGPEARDQMLWTQAQYQVLRRELAGRSCTREAGPGALSHIPEWPSVFRFPYGTCNQGALGTTAELGLAACQWSLVTGDPAKGQSAQAIARAVLAGVKGHRGAIIVAHANGHGWNTARSLPLFIPELQRQGYRFVTLSELLAAGSPILATDCYEEHPGDNRRYDTLYGRSTGK